MAYSLIGDLGIALDFGRDQPGDVLQRWQNDKWRPGTSLTVGKSTDNGQIKNFNGSLRVEFFNS